jgi:peptidylprolyl isomerase/peptidyl-prolyl cis-trans isomerase B (cyclophilin B)
MKKRFLFAILTLITLTMTGKDSFAQATDTKKYDIIQLTTKFGDILFWLYDETPKHKENFLKLAKEGFYNGTTFHRIINDFMIQGGDPNSKDSDPTNDGIGGPGYTIEAEFRPTLLHDYGALAAARMGDAANPQKRSSGSQFYIVQNKKGTHFLDNNYSVFGKVLSGMEFVDMIAVQPKDGRDRPTTNITMQVKVVSMTKKELKEKFNFVF